MDPNALTSLLFLKLRILIGRPEHVGVINKRGFHLVTPTGTYNLKIPAVTSPNQIDFTANDVVFLCMKGQDTEQALRDLKTVTADVPVFCFQNAVRNEEIAFKIFRPAFEEAMLILEKANIKWISQEQVARDWPEITAPLRGQINTEERPSTWQSLMRRQGSVETEFLNGEIVRVAKNLGLQAPINENLVKIALQMAANCETPGKYTSTQLSEILGLTGKG